MSNAADLLIETLANCGVDTIYGLPGDGINGIMEAIRTHPDQMRFIQVRHEESAAFMATAHAKLTGRLGSAHQRGTGLYRRGKTHIRGARGREIHREC